MSHGDDSGLRLPPNVAPIQVVIVPISIGNWKEDVLPAAKDIERELLQLGVRVKIDDREEFTPGWKFSEWEMRGVPLRIEIGPRDIKNKHVISVRRDTLEKEQIPFSELSERIPLILKDIQNSLFESALKFQTENTHEVQTYDKFQKIMDSQRGFIKAFWCGEPLCEKKIKDETMATIRIVLSEDPHDKKEGHCILCGKDSGKRVLFAKSY